jgi:flagellar biosynthesis/type III secretory pathway M-ring protein FliF/YscJ
MASKTAWRPIQISAASANSGFSENQNTSNKYAGSAAGQIQDSSNDVGRKNDSKNAAAHTSTNSKTYPEDEQRARVISRLTEESPATVAEIIQIWLGEDEKNHG